MHFHSCYSYLCRFPWGHGNMRFHNSHRLKFILPVAVIIANYKTMKYCILKKAMINDKCYPQYIEYAM